MKTPLAWLQLTREKVRLLVAIAGITFADILMFMQFGFRDALLSSSITFHQSIKGNIFLVGKQSTALIAMDRFPRQRLYQALAFGGVSAVHPIYIGLGMWKNPDPARQANRLFCKENFLIEPTKQGDKVLECPNTRQIMVIGFQPEYELFDLPAVNERREAMKLTDVLLFDQESRPEFGPIPQMYAKGEVIETELSNRRVQVGGLFTLGASFAADANVMTSDLNFMRIFPSRSLDEIDIGVIQLSAGADEAAILGAMRQYLPKDVWVFSRQEFFSWEQKYWKESTPIGFIFTLGAAMGFVVGVVIVYQILYTDVADHLPEYATLKAMGYSDAYFFLLVLQEAFLLAILGYLPSLFVANILYGLAYNATSLPMAMTLTRALRVFLLTLIMCILSGAIAMRKLQEADPADIF